MWDASFKKGYSGFLQERRLARLEYAEGAEPTQSSLSFTDWDQDAVVDEDDYVDDIEDDDEQEVYVPRPKKLKELKEDDDRKVVKKKKNGKGGNRPVRRKK